MLHKYPQSRGLQLQPAMYWDIYSHTLSYQVEALKLLTHDQDVDYYDYVREIKKNPIAEKVKMSDLKHNMDLSRLDEINEYIEEQEKELYKY